MTSRDFCYWLQGFFEIAAQSPFAGTPNAQGLSEHQVESIRRHLALVFVHEIDPSAGGPEHQAKLNAIHNGMTPEQVDELKKRIEDLEKRPPQKVVHQDSGSPFGPVMRC